MLLPLDMDKDPEDDFNSVASAVLRVCKLHLATNHPLEAITGQNHHGVSSITLIDDDGTLMGSLTPYTDAAGELAWKEA